MSFFTVSPPGTVWGGAVRTSRCANSVRKAWILLGSPGWATATLASNQNYTRESWPSDGSSSSASKCRSAPRTSRVNRSRCTSGTANGTSIEVDFQVSLIFVRAVGFTTAPCPYLAVWCSSPQPIVLAVHSCAGVARDRWGRLRNRSADRTPKAPQSPESHLEGARLNWFVSAICFGWGSGQDVTSESSGRTAGAPTQARHAMRPQNVDNQRTHDEAADH